jgi:molybdopterin-guanine dinucleotide biosynthesis protein A
MSDLAGAILCGGRSTRMGQPKALLPFGPKTLLEHIVDRIAEAADPLIVVAAPDQPLPHLPNIQILRDPVEGRGPLQGIAVALAALPECNFVFISSTDAPFIHAQYIRRLRALCEDHDIAIVRDEGHHHPLGAIYKPWLAREAQALLAENRARPFFLLERAKTRIVTRYDLLADPALRRADPDLWCLRNLNTPEDYEAALRDLALAE